MKLDADPTVIYPVTKGKPLGRRILKSELNAQQRLQHLSQAGSAGRADRQSRQGEHRRRCSTRRRPRRCISSPTAPAAMCLPTRLRNIRRTSQNGMRSGVNGGRCEEPGNRSRAAVHGQPAVVRGGDCVGHVADDEPARRGRRRGHPARAHQRRHFPAQQRDRHTDPLALAGWLLFPQRRPRWPARDWAIIAVLAVLVLTGLYQLFWLRSVVQ